MDLYWGRRWNRRWRKRATPGQGHYTSFTVTPNLFDDGSRSRVSNAVIDAWRESPSGQRIRLGGNG